MVKYERTNGEGFIDVQLHFMSCFAGRRLTSTKDRVADVIRLDIIDVGPRKVSFSQPAKALAKALTISSLQEFARYVITYDLDIASSSANLANQSMDWCMKPLKPWECGKRTMIMST